jgi:hypothetical protein
METWLYTQSVDVHMQALLYYNCRQKTWTHFSMHISYKMLSYMFKVHRSSDFFEAVMQFLSIHFTAYKMLSYILMVFLW